jgi:thiosulfate dehydrogenase
MDIKPDQEKLIGSLTKTIRHLLIIVFIQLVLLIISPILFIYRKEVASFFKIDSKPVQTNAKAEPVKQIFWIAPDIESITDPVLKAQVIYGKELIAHTSKYLGPKGSVKPVTNGMNCQNCHLDAGTRTFGNNYGSVASTYPKFRARSGAMEDIYKRVNDCIERSLNGQALDTLSKEMQAIKSYITFLGTNVEKGEKAKGSGLKDLPYLNRSADVAKGKEVYVLKCQSCHIANGEGQMGIAGNEYLYPALWGKNSYNDAAGLFRISNFAKYVKYNMPFGVNHTNPQLSDEESWDVAAFVNSQSRPHKDVPKDWPDKSKKPVDHPFGPYADHFTEQQHKYGPFQPIVEEMNKIAKK